MIEIDPSWQKLIERYDSSIKLFNNARFKDAGLDIPYRLYICPLCNNQYISRQHEGDSWYLSSEFTEDHFPPQNSGNKKRWVLACRSCNSDSGHLFEDELVKYLEMISYNKKIPTSSTNIKITSSNVMGWYHGTVYHDENGRLNILINPKQEKERNLRNWYEGESKLTFKNPDMDKVARSLLKAAYLYCFYAWGYEFVYSTTAEVMRKGIKGDISNWSNVTGGLSFDADNVPDFDSLHTGLVYFSNHEGLLHGVFAMIPLELETSGYKTIIPVQIPNPAEDWIEEIVSFKNSFNKGEIKEIHSTPINHNIENIPTIPGPYIETFRPYIKRMVHNIQKERNLHDLTVGHPAVKGL